MNSAPLPWLAIALGLAGLLPQAGALALTFDEAGRFVGLAAGYFYAALIFSFLGGIWWGVASNQPQAPRWIYGIAVAPSLVALATGLPWMNGGDWPGPSLTVLGFAILMSPLVDLRLARRGLVGRDLLRLRALLSFGLGLLTLGLALRA